MATTSTEAYLWTPLTPSMPLCPPIQEQIEQLPITPPDSAQPFNEKPRKIDESAVQRALHVLANERAALAHLENLYQSSLQAQSFLSTAINQILRGQRDDGKIVFTGIGKSRLIALKLVATFISLGIHSVFLHPTDALHGDLGMIRSNDVVLMITFSGKTPELLSLLPHIPAYIPLIAMTAHFEPETCPLLSHPCRSQSTNILLPAPVHQSEKSTFGLSAPTTSTTVAMALGDSLALSVAERLHSAPGRGPPEVFASFHPGGAIGATFVAPPAPVEPRIVDVAVAVAAIPIISQASLARPLIGLDLLSAAVRSNRGWLRTSATEVISPRRLQNIAQPNWTLSQLRSTVNQDETPLVIEKSDWISVLGSCTIAECKQWIKTMREEGDGRGKQFLKRGTVLGLVDGENKVSAVCEIEDVVGEDFFDNY